MLATSVCGNQIQALRTAVTVAAMPATITERRSFIANRYTEYNKLIVTVGSLS
jgi:hypothetical protein